MNKPLDPLLEGYVDLLQEAKRARRTVVNTRQALETFQEWLTKSGIEAKSITQIQFKDYIRHLQTKYADGSVKRHFITVRSCYKYATEMGWAERNPTAGLSKLLPREHDKEPELYTAAELRAMVGAVQHEREELLLYGLALTGLRQFELLKLKWHRDTEVDSYVDFESNQMVIIGKQSKLRYVPLHPILREKMLMYRGTARGQHSTYVVESSWSGWGQMSPSTATTMLKGLLTRAGVSVPAKPSHSFRKTLNTNLTRQGVKGNVLDEIFGWAKTTVRERYYTGRSTDEAQSAIQMAYQDDPVFPEQSHLTVNKTVVTQEGEDTEKLILKLQNEILELRLQQATAVAA